MAAPERTAAWALRLAPYPLLWFSAARMWSYTVDDAYISFRYARNLTRGLGLVYNPGEAVEGYTNFLWTVLLGIPHLLGVDPALFAKAIGVLAATTCLEGARRLAARAVPGAGRLVPWLLASSVPFVGHAIFGLETGLFAALLLWGVVRMIDEEERARDGETVSPLGSGALFALALLTRPDGPLWVGLAGVMLSASLMGRRNLLRAAYAGGPLLLLLVFRLQTYGHLVPNTLAAKTGDWGQQVATGVHYLAEYARASGPVAAMVVLAVLLAGSLGSRVARFLALGVVAWTSYVLAVGGDWMIQWRFLAPEIPLAFALVDAAFVRLWRRRGRPVRIALALVVLAVVPWRVRQMRAGWDAVEADRRAWDEMLDAPVDWLLRAPPGEVAFADLGFVGYTTDRPIFDLLGLMAPEIANLDGGYTLKDGRGLAEAVVGRGPTYIFMLSLLRDCHHPVHHGMRALYEQPDGIMVRRYAVADTVPWYGEMIGCFWERASVDVAEGLRVVFDFEGDDLADWTVEGEAFAENPAMGARHGQGPVSGVVGQGYLSSFHPTLGDRATGKVTSPEFELDRDFLAWHVGGGFLRGAMVRLMVDDEELYRATGRNTENLDRIVMDVRRWSGKRAHLEVIDAEAGPWGHILLDRVELFDLPDAPPPPPERRPHQPPPPLPLPPES